METQEGGFGGHKDLRSSVSSENIQEYSVNWEESRGQRLSNRHVLRTFERTFPEWNS